MPRFEDLTFEQQMAVVNAAQGRSGDVEIGADGSATFLGKSPDDDSFLTRTGRGLQQGVKEKIGQVQSAINRPLVSGDEFGLQPAVDLRGFKARETGSSAESAGQFVGSMGTEMALYALAFNSLVGMLSKAQAVAGTSSVVSKAAEASPFIKRVVTAFSTSKKAVPVGGAFAGDVGLGYEFDEMREPGSGKEPVNVGFNLAFSAIPGVSNLLKIAKREKRVAAEVAGKLARGEIAEYRQIELMKNSDFDPYTQEDELVKLAESIGVSPWDLRETMLVYKKHPKDIVEGFKNFLSSSEEPTTSAVEEIISIAGTRRAKDFMKFKEERLSQAMSRTERLLSLAEKEVKKIHKDFAPYYDDLWVVENPDPTYVKYLADLYVKGAPVKELLLLPDVGSAADYFIKYSENIPEEWIKNQEARKMAGNTVEKAKSYFSAMHGGDKLTKLSTQPGSFDPRAFAKSDREKISASSFVGNIMDDIRVITNGEFPWTTEVGGVARKGGEGAFSELAFSQRNLPEKAMLRLQNTRGSQILGVLAEDAGDLIHRMSESNTFETGGHEYVLEKVDRLLRRLDSYNLKGEIEHQLAENARYFEETKTGIGDVKELKKAFDKAREDYVNAHLTLKPFNEAQKTARSVAIAIGEMRFDDAKEALLRLKGWLGEGVNAWTNRVHSFQEAPRTRGRKATPETEKARQGMEEEFEKILDEVEKARKPQRRPF